MSVEEEGVGIINMKTPCDFPEDIILEEIVSRLPLKSVLRLRSVCERWRGFIDSERFTEKHLRLSAKVSAVLNFCFGLGVYHLQTASLLGMDKEDLLDDAGDSHLWNHVVHAIFNVVGCCNGFVCIYSTSGVYYLWNPSTRITKELPRPRADGKPPTNSSLAGFGWDESSNAYKVFAIESQIKNGRRISSSLCKVYSSKTDSWRAVEERRGFDGIYRGGKFVKGKLHWQRRVDGGYAGEIVSLDVKSEEFGVMEQPCSRGAWTLGVIGNELRQHEQQLCVVSWENPLEDRLDIWVFKDEGWIKFMAAAAAIHHGFPVQFNAPQLIFVSRESEGLIVYNTQRNQVMLIPDWHLCLQTLARF